MNPSKPLILITNDDGYEAKGIWALVKAALPHGEVVIITPDTPRSGMSHAITMNVPLRIKKFVNSDGIAYYRTNGTPVDCVKLGQKVILKDRKIDLILSGINHGSNSSVSLLYSGTMAAAIEGSFENIPSIGFSLLDYSSEADFTAAEAVASDIIAKVIANPFPANIALNVNIPKVPLKEIKGYKITRQTKGYWNEDLIENIDAFGTPYYWISGYLVNTDSGTGNCEEALAHHFVSINPVQTDLTAYPVLNDLKFLEK
ncbi:MAG: 5'/3'-nucleotidase SurE [Bacteroidales bacterium]|jgi:5'-nucleotidase|nr:5'/3'-nucleotidase SurE [Bacteroidales bacterium]